MVLENSIIYDDDIMSVPEEISDMMKFLVVEGGALSPHYYRGFITEELVNYLRDNIEDEFDDEISIIKRSSLATKNTPQKLTEILFQNAKEGLEFIISINHTKAVGDIIPFSIDEIITNAG